MLPVAPSTSACGYAAKFSGCLLCSAQPFRLSPRLPTAASVVCSRDRAVGPLEGLSDRETYVLSGALAIHLCMNVVAIVLAWVSMRVLVLLIVLACVYVFVLLLVLLLNFVPGR